MTDLELQLDLPEARVVRVRAENPGPLTLSGTNTYVVERGGNVWVIDPGPLDDSHLSRVEGVVRRLGSAAGVALSHDHGDHSDGVSAMAERLGGVPVLRHGSDVPDPPFEPVHTPGHAADHLVFTLGDAVFSGDLLLGGSSTIVPPGGGTLIAYLDSLQLVAERGPSLILPGHGEPVENGAAALAAQREHRLAREAALVEALGDGLRDREELLSRVWHDVAPHLRLAAHVTMQSHLEKLDIEGRLPSDFEPDGRVGWHGRG